MKSLKAYKVFNPDWTCRDFQFEVGKTYELKEKPVMCEIGFHACKKVQDCFNYYSFNPNNKVAEVLLEGVVLDDGVNKQCSNKITIVKELSWNEMLDLANNGKGNSGHSNSGNWNSGYSNSGHSNSGHSNSGNWNSGNWNSGHRNSGHRNSGHWNKCNQSNGYFNSISPNEIMVFNNTCNIDVWNNAKKPSFIYNIILNEWVYFDNMSEEEKKEHPKAYVCDGYLKSYSYKEAWQNAFNESEVELLKSLPNFDANVFYEITGIKLS